jgi:hypothetical protein
MRSFCACAAGGDIEGFIFAFISMSLLALGRKFLTVGKVSKPNCDVKLKVFKLKFILRVLRGPSSRVSIGKREQQRQTRKWPVRKKFSCRRGGKQPVCCSSRE